MRLKARGHLLFLPFITAFLFLPKPGLATGPPASRVFVAARTGNDANSCNSIATPCQTFAGVITQVAAGGEVIVLESGGYGAVTITQGVTIEAPVGVTAFIHPASGPAAITVNAGTGKVTLRGLTLNVGTGNGIAVYAVGTLNVENCFITGFQRGIVMLSPGWLNVKGTDITACDLGLDIENSSGLVQASIDHCHLDGNGYGLFLATISPGSSTTTATYTTANNNDYGWLFANGTNGKAVLNLEFCSGSENANDGVKNESPNALSVVRYSFCVFANNTWYGVTQASSGKVESRGNNTITGNGAGPTQGTIGSLSAM